MNARESLDEDMKLDVCSGSGWEDGRTEAKVERSILVVQGDNEY